MEPTMMTTPIKLRPPSRSRAALAVRRLLKISCLIIASQLIIQATHHHHHHNHHLGSQDAILAAEASQLQKDAASTLNETQSVKHQQHQQDRQQASDLLAFAAANEHHQMAVAAAAGKSKTCKKGPQPHQNQHHQPQLQQTRHHLVEGQQAASLSSTMLRAFIRTNNMRAYHLDLHSYRPEAKFEGDPAFVQSLEPSHQARCGRHLNHYASLMAAYFQTDPMEMSNSLEALKLADTFGRPDSGLLEGHQFWLGSYESCLDFSATLRDVDVDADSNQFELDDGHSSQSVNGQYCLGLAQFPSWMPRDTKMSIKIGMCLPETCTSSMLNEQQDLLQIVEQMMKYQLTGPLAKLKLRSVYCLPHETSVNRQLTLSSKLFVSLVSIMAVACIYATIHDYLNRKTTASEAAAQVAAAARILATASQQEQQKQLATDSNQVNECEINQKAIDKLEARTWRHVVVESFSIMRNLEKIFDTKERKAPSSQTVETQAESEFRFNKEVFFSSITGIKCIGLIWIIAAHCFLVGPITHKNLIGLDKLTQTYLANVYLAAHLMVDSFFALSGLLASYLLFKSHSIDKMNFKTWLVLTVHRYWRLTPVYLLAFWFAKTLGSQVNSGPLWDYATASQSPRLNCANESWLEALLHLSDFKSPKEHCVPFAWFIANGIKFWMVTPIFLTAIYKSARAGYTLLAASIVANICIVVSLAINSNVDMKSVIEFKPESADNMLNNMEEVYTRPYSRIGAYLVGLMAGHMIYLVETQQRPVNMSERMKILTWSLVSATAILLTFVIKIASGVELEDAAIPWVFSFSSAIIRPLWALCTCWLVFALAHGQARWVSKLLSANMWRILARLSFCAYLTQGEVIANLFLSYTHSSPYTYTEMITRPIVATVTIVALSVVAALLVEYPLIGIEELLLPRRLEKATKRASVNGEIKTVNESSEASTETTNNACDLIVNERFDGKKSKEL